MHHYDSTWVDLRQESADFLFANRSLTVRKEKVDGTVDLHLQARLVARVDPLRESRGLKPLYGGAVDLRIVFAGDNFSHAVGFQSFGDAQGAQAGKCSRLDDQLRREQWLDLSQHRRLRILAADDLRRSGQS